LGEIGRESEEKYVSDLIADSYAYLRAILTKYLEDPTLVEVLKEN
jgi:hypothetical protein